MRKRTITVNGFSKIYSMTGWRIGYVVSSKLIISEIVKMQQSAVSCATAFAQKGAVAALNGPPDFLWKMLSEFTRRRDFIVDGLNEVMGLSVVSVISGRRPLIGLGVGLFGLIIGSL
jgi:aspartate/methionine/tyrosine aminotransferase